MTISDQPTVGGKRLRIRYSHEGRDFGDALETAGGIGRALPLLGDVFWVAAGDVYVPGFEFTRRGGPFRRQRQAGAPVAGAQPAAQPERRLRPRRRLASRSNEPGPDGRLPHLSRPSRCIVPNSLAKTSARRRSAILHGVQAALAPLLRSAIARGEVSAELYDGAWTDVGTPRAAAATEFEPGSFLMNTSTATSHLTQQPAIHADRRARLARQLGPDGIAIIPTALERPRNRDSDFLFRHDSYFYYLTGFTEPNAWLVLTGDGKTTLFCAPKDLEREIWDGYRLGPEAAPDALGVERRYSVNELDQRLPKLLENRDTVWYPFATTRGWRPRVDGWLNQRARARALRRAVPRAAARPVRAARRDAAGQGRARTGHHAPRRRDQRRAHIRAMRLSARMLREGRDVREYHLDAELLHEFRMRGSQYPAYARSSPPAPTPACCTTAPTWRRCARASWC